MLFHDLLPEKIAIKYWAFFSLFKYKIQISSKITHLTTIRAKEHKNHENFPFLGIYKDFLKNLP